LRSIVGRRRQAPSEILRAALIVTQMNKIRSTNPNQEHCGWFWSFVRGDSKIFCVGGTRNEKVNLGFGITPFHQTPFHQPSKKILYPPRPVIDVQQD
jgi:hypothetical protein